MSESTDPGAQLGNGYKNVAISGSSNIVPVLHDTLGMIFLGIIALMLLFDVRRLTNVLLKIEHKGCDCKCCQGKGCSCGCCKCGCCEDEKGCNCDCEGKEEPGEPEKPGE